LAGTHLALALLGEYSSAHSQHRLESFLALLCVVAEAGHALVFDAVLDALPAAAKGGNLGVLDELGLGGADGLVNNGLLNGDEVGEGEVLGDHGDGLRGRVDVGGFEDVRDVRVGTGAGAANKRGEPLGSGLLASDEALSAEDPRSRVDAAADGVDGDYVRRLVVPWAVLAPVGGRDLLPGVVEGHSVGEDLHCGCGGRLICGGFFLFGSRDDRSSRDGSETFFLSLSLSLSVLQWSIGWVSVESSSSK
ncbi:hypothetical protein CI238_11057, partial [Colletotrichum incanum]